MMFPLTNFDSIFDLFIFIYMHRINKRLTEINVSNIDLKNIGKLQT